jgi:MerR family transcriptional regulator, redox-sensitive transcriptional activator SoxR
MERSVTLQVDLKSSGYDRFVPRPSDRLTIGDLAARSGIATSAIRFYESVGLIASERTSANHRLYARATLRRVAFIRAAKRTGLSLDEIAGTLASLPADRSPTKADWRRLSRTSRARLDERIAELVRLRDDLDGCIGCGCLSLRSCALFNPGDVAAAGGSGPRYLLGDSPPRR